MEKIKRNPEVASFLKKLKCVEPRNQLTFEKFIEGIQSESLFGLLISSIHTPEELKPKFSDFPPIIKNTTISRSDIGEHMQKIAEEQGFLKNRESTSSAVILEKSFLSILGWQNSIWSWG